MNDHEIHLYYKNKALRKMRKSSYKIKNKKCKSTKQIDSNLNESQHEKSQNNYQKPTMFVKHAVVTDLKHLKEVPRQRHIYTMSNIGQPILLNPIGYVKNAELQNRAPEKSVLYQEKLRMLKTYELIKNEAGRISESKLKKQQTASEIRKSRIPECLKKRDKMRVFENKIFRNAFNVLHGLPPRKKIDIDKFKTDQWELSKLYTKPTWRF